MADHIALYRKYRPQVFSELIGQEHIRTILLRAAVSGRIAHAYLFSGPRGSGKTTTARLVAKLLNCTALKEGEPCNVCEYCVAFNAGQLIDVIEVDGASNRGIDEIRDLREKALFTPTHAKKKVFIIDEVHMLTKEAFNALLKILEEPVSHINFILATTEFHKVPATIVSRCQHFDFLRITPTEIAAHLANICAAEKIKAEPGAVESIALASDGSLRDALVLLEQLTVGDVLSRERVEHSLGIMPREAIRGFVALLEAGDTTAVLHQIDTLYQTGVQFAPFIQALIDETRSLMRDSAQEKDIARAQRYAQWIELLVQALARCKETPVPQLPLELAVLKMVQRTGITETPARIVTQPVAATSLDSRPSTDPVSSLDSKLSTASQLSTEAPISGDPELTPEPKPATGSGTSLVEIRKQWQTIVAKIEAPKVRLAMRTAKVASLENNKLTLLFPSQFEFEHAGNIRGRTEVEQALRVVMTEDFQVICKHDPTARPVIIKTESIAKPAKPSVQAALDILGGTLLPE